jgi:release factor glutamine methyltransferase
MTLQQALLSGAQQLAADPAFDDSARRDAELLMMHLLDLDRAALLANPARELSSTQLRDYETLIARRSRHEPIQYIVGVQEFYGLPLEVTPAVLIPRPETEHLVEAVLERLLQNRPARILDVGTGSGAIAIALATHLPLATVTALDLSPEAIEIALINTGAFNLTERVRFAVSDLLDALSEEERHEHFDAVVSNPPYIPVAEAAELHPQVREYEPASALFAGADGLDVYRRLIPQAQGALKPGGLLALEIGHGQSQPIAELLRGWDEVVFVNDLQSIPRVALAKKAGR